MQALKKLAQQDDPHAQGKALAGRLAGLRRYRVGDYRVIYYIEEHEMIILAIEVGHHSDIYD